jgi:hypothetical protein
VTHKHVFDSAMDPWFLKGDEYLESAGVFAHGKLFKVYALYCACGVFRRLSEFGG